MKEAYQTETEQCKYDRPYSPNLKAKVIDKI